MARFYLFGNGSARILQDVIRSWLECRRTESIQEYPCSSSNLYIKKETRQC